MSTKLPKELLLICLLFTSLLVLTTLFAYSRTSSATGLDMAKMQQLRHQYIATSEPQNH